MELKVTYSIHPGTPGHIPSVDKAGSIIEARAAYRDYMVQCDRIGNEFADSFMTVVDSRGGEHMFQPGRIVGTMREVKL